MCPRTKHHSCANNWCHAGEPLTVAQLARSLCYSVWTLQASYRAVFDTTVWEDLAARAPIHAPWDDYVLERTSSKTRT